MFCCRSDPYITNVPPVNSWYDNYQNWLVNGSAYSRQLVNGRAPNETAFNGWLKVRPGMMQRGCPVKPSCCNVHAVVMCGAHNVLGKPGAGRGQLWYHGCTPTSK